MNNEKEKNKAIAVANELAKHYPSQACGLLYEGNAFRLLVMAVLSAQCTDKRVNIVAEKLFEVLPDAQAFANSKPGQLEELIHSVGLFNSKSKNLRAAAKRLVEVYNGKVPSEMADLLTLGGVGRKVANLIRGDVFGLGGIVADTHCIRIVNRLGFTTDKNPLHTEKTMSALLPLDEQSAFCHRLVDFGRDICRAQSPKCEECFLKSYCIYKSK